MQDHRVFQVGGRLQAVRDFLRNDPAQGKAFQDVDLLVSSVAVARHAEIESGFDVSSDTYFIARILLGILQRGNASFVSPFVEHSLLDENVSPRFLFDHDGLNRKLEHVQDGDGLAERLVAALLSPEPSVEYHALADTDSETEVIFLRDVLPQLLGSAIALVEPQRPLESMLVDELARVEFIGQRVDFAFETPSGAKIVFEVDGDAFHSGERRLRDQRRDHALKEAGWLVERIPARDVLRGQVALSNRVRDAVARDRTIKALNRIGAGQHDAASDASREARIVIAPHAVARIQMGILLAMLDGRLSLDASLWTIGVIERDLPVADVAVIDLYRQMTHLCEIYRIESAPEVDLAIARTHGVPPQSPPVHPQITTRRASKRELRELDADVIVDVSVRTRPADLRHGDPLPPTAFRDTPVYELRTAYRRLPEEPLPWPDPRPIEDTDGLEEPLTFFLQMLFRKAAFKPKQLDIIARALQRKDVLGLLPTGGGKSLTFQLPTLLSPGLTIIVAPLKSLIDDQIDNLHRVGIDRGVGIHSGQSRQRKEHSLALIAQGHPRFLYIAPERFHIQAFREEIQSSVLARSIAYVVVDEAHCVSEWGHDFRPAYLSVAHQARRLFLSGDGPVPIMALTATASDTVLIDVQRELDFDREDNDSLVSIESFGRKELKFLPLIVSADRKQQAIRDAVARAAVMLDVSTDKFLADPTRAGVVFCRYVNGQFGVWGVRGVLCTQTGSDTETIRVYAGSQPRDYRGPQPWEDYKQRVQRDFKDDKFPVLVATSSFGMGIDKPNIRFTLHYGIPHSVEALAQEAGRAGRDGDPAACAIVFTARQPLDRTRYLDPQISASEVAAALDVVPRHEQDDAYRVLFLLTRSYPGVERELEQLRRTFAQIEHAWAGHQADGAYVSVVLSRRRRDDKEAEKAVYRLTVLGVVDDYTVDYQNNTITVYSAPRSPEEMEARLEAYIRRYDTPERAALVLREARLRRRVEAPADHVLHAMCTFVYDVIERSRREALRNIVERLERTQGDGEALAREIELYLSKNVFTSAVADMVDRIDADEWFDLIDRATTDELARRLVATCQRQLESYPTHPGLHLLSGLGMLRQGRYSMEGAVTNVIAALRNYVAQHGSSDEMLVGLVRRLLEANRKALDLATGDAFIARLVDGSRNDQVARAAYSFATSPELRRLCAVPWLKTIAWRSQAIRQTAQEHV